MHCYSKLKKNHKWQLTRISLSKGKDAIDLDAPLATSAGRTIGNRVVKAVLANAASSEKTQALITQCLVEVSSTLFSRDKKANESWAALLKKQEDKMELKKRKDDMSLLRAPIEGMSPRTRTTHNFFKGQILDDIEAKMAAAQAAASTPTPEQEPADAFATASASTPASAYVLASEHAHRTDHDEVAVIDGPASTQDAPLASASPKPFF
jgi:small-conductance mechanosensitive channel